MTKIITTAVLIFLVSSLTAQTDNKSIMIGNVISDKTTFTDKTYKSPLPSILKSLNKIEIRFIQAPSFEGESYIILTFNKSWAVNHFYYKRGKDSMLSKEIIKKYNLDTLFSHLVTHNIFSLPDDSNLKLKKYSYDPETNEFSGSQIGISDGISYFIEFKVGNYYRRYGYSNPQAYSEFYPYVHELRDFSNIVETFSELTQE